MAIVGGCISCGCFISFENKDISIQKPFIIDKETGYYFCSELCRKEFYRVLMIHKEGKEIQKWGILCPLK